MPGPTRRLLDEAEFTAIRQRVIASAPDGLDEQGFARYFKPTFDGAIAEAEYSPAPVEGSALRRFASGVAESFNPVTMVKGAVGMIRQAIDGDEPSAADLVRSGQGSKALSRELISAIPGMGPVLRATGLAGQMGDEVQKATDLSREGRFVEAAGHAAAGSLPMIGPAAVHAGERIAAGDVAGGVGAGVGMVASVGAPRVVAGAVRRGVSTPKATNPNLVEADAIRWGQEQGIPIDAGTATGNRFVRGAQALADNSPLGAGVAERAQQAGANALRTVGSSLAKKVHPHPVVPEMAGQAVRDSLRSTVSDLHAKASHEYGRLRAIEAEALPDGWAGGMSVDMQPVKAALQPVYDRLIRQLPVTQQQASKGLKAIENIVNGPDVAPVSLADADLSAIKSISRGADLPELRDVSQGLAAKAIKELDAAVQTAVDTAGPEAARALRAGRGLTREKHRAADVLRRVREEPVQAFQQAVYSKDAGIKFLREVKAFAPDEMPKLGRAFIEDLLTTATEKGGFDKGAAIYTKWKSLGPETRRMLFGQSTTDLDRFFLLAERMAHPANPSKSALVLNAGSQAMLVFTNPATGIPVVLGSGALAKVLHSPAAVKLLTRGMRLAGGPQAATAASRASAGGVLSRAAEAAGVDLQAAPMAAEADPEATP